MNALSVEAYLNLYTNPEVKEFWKQYIRQRYKPGMTKLPMVNNKNERFPCSIVFILFLVGSGRGGS
jgi:hypothetical protein